jgi:ribosomal protein L11 methyltransferase
LSWLEISLALNGELAEPVAELLARYADGGVALVQMPDDDATPESDLNIIVRAYLPLDAQLDERKQAIEEGLWHLGQIIPLPTPEYQEISQQDWNESWRKRYQPIPIGKTLMVLPAWLEKPSSDRHMMIIEPGMAFGTGTHPTTILSLLAIEDHCQDGDLMIDLGCGSGILSIGAIRCGATQVLAFDSDVHAISSAKHNLRLNHLLDHVQLVHGSLDEAKQIAPEGVPLLVANILAPILTELLHRGLADIVVNQGIVILSGILEEQLEKVLKLTDELGLTRLQTYSDADWRAVALRKN